MSFIDHRCTDCGHWCAHHRPERSPRPFECENCACPRPRPAAVTELVATFTVWGQPNQTIVRPGEPINLGGIAVPSACDCQYCMALYRQLTKGAA